MDKEKFLTVAAIDVGSNFLRMMIAQIYPDGKIVQLDDLRKSTHIGRDTFSYGRIRAESIHHTCDTLNGFCNLMKDYKVKSYRAVSTTGIREAENSQYVLEQIRLRTGLTVGIINNAQERFLMYKAVRDHLPDPNRISSKGTMILDISSGGVEVSVYSKGNLKFTEYIKIGSLRLREILSNLERITLDFPSIMEEFVDSRIGFLESRIQNMDIEYFIGLGGEIKTITSLCLNDSIKAQEGYIQNKSLAKLYSKVQTMTTEQIIEEYGLQKNQAEILLPSVIIYYRFLQMTGAKGVYAPMISLRNGILADMADERFDTSRRKDFINDIISSVWYIGKRYFIDEVHSAHVEKLALLIFDQTHRIHGMNDRERFYLQVACILHDIGKHVNLNQHDIHSYNIIRNQDILGFSNEELELVANVARYHSEEVPQASHDNYIKMNTSDRIVVSKLSSIIRLAEALDISHKQKINNIEISTSGKELNFKAYISEEILLEEWNFSHNAIFFEEVMGYKPIIKSKGKQS